MSLQVSWESAAAGALVPAVSGLFLWLKARAEGKKDALSGEATLIKVAQEAAAEMMATLQGQIERLEKKVEKLETERDGERRARQDERHELRNRLAAEAARAGLAERRAEVAEQRCTLAEGRQRDLQQQLDSLTRSVRAVGVNVPAPPDRSTEPIILGEPIT